MQKLGNSDALHRSGAVKIPHSSYVATFSVGFIYETEQIDVLLSQERSGY